MAAEHNRGRPDSDGRPDRDAREIERWAHEHDLPYFDDRVHFPDFRIEDELQGRDRHEDVELVTEHYRGAHARSVARAGFRCYGRAGGSGRSGGRSVDPRVAEDFMMKSVSIRLRQSGNPFRIGTLLRFGFTGQARFLVHVLVFSGVFIERQYRAFAGVAHGQKTHD